ncbi:MAG: hydroxyacylglutathione hydrolase [Bauldia sp.]
MGLLYDLFICRTDNFGVLVHDEATGTTAAIDAPDAVAIEQRLRARGWHLGLILVTHRHGDHVAGNRALKALTGCTIVGPAAEADAIPEIDVRLGEGDEVRVGETIFHVIATPGHTAGHIAYYSADAAVAFVGDTLFSLGCGRVETDMTTMWQSLQKIGALPRETVLYCGHEYTEANGRFAITIEPNNLDLEARIAEVSRLRASGGMSIPTSVGQELATNPFLRSDRPRLRRALGMEKVDPAEIFATLRRRKDAFR